jgi:hypothetical protein
MTAPIERTVEIYTVPMKFVFPKDVQVPDRLAELLAVCKKSGSFYPSLELKAESASNVAAYFGKHASAKYAAKHLGVFAGGPDGSSYAVWAAPQGGFPVVLLGSEGDNQILAASFDQFLCWLALRDTAQYEQDDDSADDDDDKQVRKAFRAWLKAQGLTVPRNVDVIDKGCEEAIAGTLSVKTNVVPSASSTVKSAAPAATVNKDNVFAALVGCMGKPIDSPQGIAILAYLGKSMKPATPHNSTSWVEAKAFGIDLAATCTPTIRGLWPAQKVGRVYVTYMASVELGRKFASALPHGIAWGQSQSTVEKLCRPRKLTYKTPNPLLDLPVDRDDIEVLPRFDNGKLESMRIALWQELDYITASADYEKTKPLVYVEDAFFASWCALNGLLDATKFNAAATAGIRNRTQSPLAFLHGACGRLLWSSDLTEPGLAFVRVYYNGNVPDEQRWVRDVSNIFGSSNHFRDDNETPTPDDWKSFDKIALRIALRFKQWQAGKLKETSS